jgi:hypothetical protein
MKEAHHRRGKEKIRSGVRTIGEEREGETWKERSQDNKTATVVAAP